MSSVLLMTDAVEPSDHVLPALGLLAHQIRILPADAGALLNAPAADLLLVDGRRDLPGVRSLCRVIRATGSDLPVLLIVTEGGLAAVSADWGVDDIVLDTAGPGEVEARFRLAVGRQAQTDQETGPEIQHGELLINESSYTATVRGRLLDLTYKEFELLKYLSQHPGRVFTRQQLLQEVWGYDYFGGTRTVDVHVRRLRAKLGPEYEGLIGTVRNVGYRLVPPRADREPEFSE
ncbi:MAG: response regulator transcription factor [Micrococcales bacterium]|nr:response regulator transcription factor [Micrococcales bacterium]